MSDSRCYLALGMETAGFSRGLTSTALHPDFLSRDVARVHIEAAFQASAAGKRFLVSTPTRVSPERLAAILKEAVGLDIVLDEAKCRSAFPSDKVEVDAVSLTEYLRLRPGEETIGDTVRSLLNT